MHLLVISHNRPARSLEQFASAVQLTTLSIIIKAQISIFQNSQYRYNVILRRVHAGIFAVEEQYILFILSVYLQPQVYNMQCAYAILSSAACPTQQNLSTSSYKRKDFRKNVTEHKNVCFDFLYDFCVKHFLF